MCIRDRPLRPSLRREAHWCPACAPLCPAAARDRVAPCARARSSPLLRDAASHTSLPRACT
eukprot:124678-Lingulodinium_polyedra.AAC.1